MGFHFAHRFISGGAVGVDLFFVLSGFLITSLLAREHEAIGRIAYGRFIARRARRLAPALGTLLIVYLVACPFLFPTMAKRLWIDLGAAVFYVTNLRISFGGVETPLNHTWSLAIEEQFYLTWPLVLAGLLRLGRERAAMILLGAWVVITALRLIFAFLVPLPYPAMDYYFTPLHASGLCLGAALALRPIKPPRSSAPFLILLGALFIGGHSAITWAVTIPVAELITAVLIVARPSLLAIGPLTWLGRISYGVYLWHIPLLWVWRAEPTTLLSFAGLVGASIGAGWLSHILIERRFWRPSASVASPSTLESAATP
jgi:peptidoglycan/LPS O-acetylase OafA/YrhL